MEGEKPRTYSEEEIKKTEQARAVSDIDALNINKKEVEQPKLEVPEKGRLEKEKQEAERLAKEKAWEILSDPKVMDNKPEEAIKAFKQLAEKNLIEEREKRVAKNLKLIHKKIIRGEDTEKYRQWIIRKEQERILQEEHSKALDVLWERNPDIKEEDREKYLSDLRNKLGLNVRGGVVALDKLINDGYEVEKAEKGWFSGKIKTRKIGAEKDDIKKDLEQILQDIKSEITKKAEDTARFKIEEGIQILKDERLFCAKNIILEAVDDYNFKKQQERDEEEARKEKQKKEAEETEKPSQTESSEEPKSFKDWIKKGNELVERFEKTPSGRRNLDEFKEALFLLNKEFIEPKNREDDKKFREWKNDVRETINRLKKFGKPRIESPKQESAKSSKKEKPIEQKSYDELMDEYVPLRKKYNKARGKAKKELKQQMEDLKEEIKEARERKSKKT